MASWRKQPEKVIAALLGEVVAEVEEKAAAEQQRSERRNAAKRARRAAAAEAAKEAAQVVEDDPEKVIAVLLDELVAEVAEVRDKVDEGELQKELEKLVIERSGSPLLEDTGTREAAELELRADGYGAARGDDGPQVYSLPLNELQRRMADGEGTRPGEAQMEWDQRVMRDRLARGVPLGDYLQELSCIATARPSALGQAVLAAVVTQLSS